MPLGKRQRKVILILGLTLGGLMLLCVSLPLWFPWVVTSLARKGGVHFVRYERIGYSRFALHDLTFTNEDVRLRAREIDAFVPTVWLWKRLSTNAMVSFVGVNGWEFESLPSTNKTGASSTYTNVQRITAIVKIVQHWLPVASLSNGAVQVQKVALKIPVANLSHGKVGAQLGFLNGSQQAALNVNLHQRDPYDLQVRSESLGLESFIQISMDSTSITLEATNLWHTNQVELLARFGREGALPESVGLQAHRFRLTGELLALKEYRDISGSVSANWERGALALDLDAEATPIASQTNLPPLKVSIHASGDTNSVTLKTARFL